MGLILLPNRFQIRGTGMYHHCRGEPVDVATVLVFLFPDLASQIANRKAFYKELGGGIGWGAVLEMESM